MIPDSIKDFIFGEIREPVKAFVSAYKQDPDRFEFDISPVKVDVDTMKDTKTGLVFGVGENLLLGYYEVFSQFDLNAREDRYLLKHVYAPAKSKLKRERRMKKKEKRENTRKMYIDRYKEQGEIE